MPIAVCPVESYKITVLTEHDACFVAFHYQPDSSAELTWTPNLVLHRDELRKLAAAMLRTAKQLDAIAQMTPGSHRH